MDVGHLLLALVLVPFAVAAVTLVIDVGARFVPTGDLGLTELRTSDVGRHAVLIGPYSRDGWNHPGPMYFYLLAVPYRLLGSSTIGLPLGAVLINAASVIGIAVVARRRGGLPLLLVALVGVATVLHGAGAEFLRNPWNPYIVVLPFALLLFLTWEMTCGQAWALPVAAGVASFCTQTHIGYAPLTVPLVLAGGVALLLHARARRADAGADRLRRQLRRAGAWALVVLVVLWLPPVLQQVDGGPGNLREVLRYFEDPGQGHPLVQGVRAVVSQLALLPEWVTGNRQLSPFSAEPAFLSRTPFPLLLLPLVAVVVLLIRRHHLDGLRLAGVVLAAMALGAASVARTTGPAFAYRLHWNWFVAMVAVVLVAWGAWELLSPRARQRWSVPSAAAAIALLVLITGASAVNAARAGVPYARESSVAKALEDQLVRALPSGPGVVVVGTTDASGGTYQPTMVRRLERRGLDVRVATGTEEADRYGEHRLLRAGERVRARLLIVGEHFDEVRDRPDLQLVSYWGTVDLREHQRRVARLAQLQADFDAGRIGAEEMFRRAQDIELGSAVGIFLERDR